MPAMTMVQAINNALREEMRRDDRVIVLGEDVGRNGGVFRCTEGLLDEFPDRVFDTPLAEGGIIGTAIGMALYGLRPVPEIQFMDFIYPGFDQIVSEAAKMRYRSGGQFSVPMTIRTPFGGGIRGGHYHSQSTEAYFCHTPGLKVVVPSTPKEAKGLLTSSIRDPDPVLFLEPKKLYRSSREEVPEGEITVPLGQAAVRRPWKDVTLIAYGYMAQVCIDAATKAAEKGVEAEVIDLRTLVPLDEPTILASVKKTGRAVVVYEAPRTGGYGAEISAILAEKAIEYLRGPIVRVTGFDTPFPYTLEDVYLPNADRVLSAIARATPITKYRTALSRSCVPGNVGPPFGNGRRKASPTMKLAMEIRTRITAAKSTSPPRMDIPTGRLIATPSSVTERRSRPGIFPARGAGHKSRPPVCATPPRPHSSPYGHRPVAIKRFASASAAWAMERGKC